MRSREPIGKWCEHLLGLMTTLAFAVASALRMASASLSVTSFSATSCWSWAYIAGEKFAAMYSRIFFRMKTPFVQM